MDAVREARSKVEHVAGSLLNPRVAREMHIVYLTKGALATTAIEGNTLSEEEPRRQIERQLDLPPSREYLGREIDNVIAAYNEIKDELVAGAAPPMSRAVIANYNRLILEGLDLDDGVVPGEIPSHSVAVGGYLGAPREDCEFLLDRLADWLDEPGLRAPRAGLGAADGDRQGNRGAPLCRMGFHPFGDGNGRTARLMELRILLEAGVPTPATHLLSNHYNQTRTEYYRQLRDASREKGMRSPSSAMPCRDSSTAFASNWRRSGASSSPTAGSSTSTSSSAGPPPRRECVSASFGTRGCRRRSPADERGTARVDSGARGDVLREDREDAHP